MLVLLVLVLVLLVLLVRELLPSTAWLADVPHIELCVTARCVFHSLPPSPLGARAGGHRVFPFISADLVVVLSCLTTYYIPTAYSSTAVLPLLAPSRLHYEGHTTHAIQFPVGGPGHIQSPGIPLAATEDADLLFTPSLCLRVATKTAYAETRLPPTRSDRQLGSLTHTLPPSCTHQSFFEGGARVCRASEPGLGW